MAKYPSDCTTPSKRTEYMYIAQEQLRLLHNKFVTWRDVGLSTEGYDGLPGKIKNAFPYKAQISNVDWKAFHDQEFIPRSDTINIEIGKQKALFKNSDRWLIDIGETEKFVRD